jgi:predicted RNA-binding Zn-ribbon protein involved in translation (DUF1610 family)
MCCDIPGGFKVDTSIFRKVIRCCVCDEEIYQGVLCARCWAELAFPPKAKEQCPKCHSTNVSRFADNITAHPFLKCKDCGYTDRPEWKVAK